MEITRIFPNARFYFIIIIQLLFTDDNSFQPLVIFADVFKTQMESNSKKLNPALHIMPLRLKQSSIAEGIISYAFVC